MPALKYKENGEWKTIAGSTSFNGRYGNVIPQAEDYTEFYPERAEFEEAISELSTAVEGKATAYTYGTEDLTAGESELETGKLYFVYE